MDRWFFPSKTGSILQNLLIVGLIRPIEYYDSDKKRPIIFEITEKGQRHLFENVKNDNLLQIIKDLNDNEILMKIFACCGNSLRNFAKAK